MLFFNKTKPKIDYDDYPSDWTDFEKRLYKEKEHYRINSHNFLTQNIDLSKELRIQKEKIAEFENQNKQLLDALAWNEKFKSVMERLREEKWELEMENEFLRKKVKECQ